MSNDKYWTVSFRIRKPTKRMVVSLVVVALISWLGYREFKVIPDKLARQHYIGAIDGRDKANNTHREDLVEISKLLHTGKIPCKDGHGWHNAPYFYEKDFDKDYCCMCGKTYKYKKKDKPKRCERNYGYGSGKCEHGPFYPIDP